MQARAGYINRSEARMGAWMRRGDGGWTVGGWMRGGEGMRGREVLCLIDLHVAAWDRDMWRSICVCTVCL